MVPELCLYVNWIQSYIEKPNFLVFLDRFFIIFFRKNDFFQKIKNAFLNTDLVTLNPEVEVCSSSGVGGVT